ERALNATRSQLHELHRRLAGLHPRARILGHRAALADLESRLAGLYPAPRIARATHELAALDSRRDTALHDILDERRNELAQLGAQMAALSPLAVLDRGYAMVRAGDVIVRDAAQVAPGERLSVRLAKGALDVIVDKIQTSGESALDAIVDKIQTSGE